YQDVGLDGLRDNEEEQFFSDFLAQLTNLNPAAYQKLVNDPSSDNYNFFRDDDYDRDQLDVLQRYKNYNGLEGNSATNEQSQALNNEGYPTSASTLPNVEDINQDNTLDDIESYFQYRIPISPHDLNPANVGNNFITSYVEATSNTKNSEKRPIRWYQVKIPIRRQDRERIGSITDLRSIRFMRVFVSGFE